MKRFLVLLALIAYPIIAIGQVTEAEITNHFIMQEVLANTLDTEEMDPNAALDEIRDGLLGLNPSELSLLDGFSLSDQGNFALVRQEGIDNLADITQQGEGNLSIVVQEGNRIVTTTAQTGTGNVIGVHLVGTDVTDTIIQDGHDNVYLREFKGSDQEIPASTQVGTDNQIVQIGEIGTPFGVEQYGNGMRMVIIHNGID